MHLTPLRCLALMALGLSPISAIETQAQYQLTSLNVPGYFGFPSAINDNGTIALNAFFVFGPGGLRGGPVLIKGDSVTPVSVPNTRGLRLEGINAQGTIVGTAYTEHFSSFGYVRTKQGEMSTLAIPGALATMPKGINSRGVIVGSFMDENFSSHGFIWDAAGPKLFDAPAAESTELRGINASGTAVGRYTAVDISHAFTLEGSKFSPLNLPNALSSTAYGINNSGQIVGSYQSAGHPEVERGFIYDRGVVTSVDYVFSEEDAPPSFPPEPFDFGDGVSGTITYVRVGISTGITGINDRGDIIGQAGVGYEPVVDCDGCGLTPEDVGGLGVLDAFTGERDGSRTVHVKSTGKPQKIRVPHGRGMFSR